VASTTLLFTGDVNFESDSRMRRKSAWNEI